MQDSFSFLLPQVHDLFSWSIEIGTDAIVAVVVGSVVVVGIAVVVDIREGSETTRSPDKYPFGHALIGLLTGLSVKLL